MKSHRPHSHPSSVPSSFQGLAQLIHVSVSLSFLLCKTRILVPVSNFNAQTRTLLRVNQSTINNQARTTGATELSQVNRSVAALPTTCYLHLPPWAMLPVHLPSPHHCLLRRSLPLFSPSNYFLIPTPSLSYHVPSWRSHTRRPTQHGPPTCVPQLSAMPPS